MSKITKRELQSTLVTELEGKINASEKGVASGVATLGTDSKIPSTQLPALDFIPTTEKGALSGVATLNASGLVVQNPATAYIPASQKGSASGVASLDASGSVPSTQLGNAPKEWTRVTSATLSANTAQVDIAVSGYKYYRIIAKWLSPDTADRDLWLTFNDDTSWYAYATGGAPTTGASSMYMQYVISSEGAGYMDITISDNGGVDSKRVLGAFTFDLAYYRNFAGIHYGADASISKITFKADSLYPIKAGSYYAVYGRNDV